MGEKINLYQVYSRRGQEYIPYSGEPNFPAGHKQCPRCKKGMTREPLDVLYLSNGGDKTLITTTGSGRMVLQQILPSFLWCCVACNYAEHSDTTNAIK